MTRTPIKIGVAGTHSTGKSSFFKALAPVLEGQGLKTSLITGLAQRASQVGFPILTEHSFESTLWIMAECMRQEAEASLTCDVILVDRPVLDALGYLEAALELTGRRLDLRRLDELRTIARVHSADYDLHVITALDRTIPLGEGRDQDTKFREAAARHIEALAAELAPFALHLTSANVEETVDAATAFVASRVSRGPAA